jgi:coenzyme F420 hydrogenase subunit beta
MAQKAEFKGQAFIREQVLKQGLCTGCAACVSLCPYQGFYKDHTAVIHQCDREWGRCQAYCPRGPVDLAALKAALYEAQDLTPEIGACKGLYITRAADPVIRQKAQHGGTVSALMALALSSGLIDTAILADKNANWQSRGVSTKSAGQVAEAAGSKFAVSPTVAQFNQASQGEAKAIGVVATPCQALALAKMQHTPQPGDEERIAKLKLTIGLFCGWALDWESLAKLIQEEAAGAGILGMDIPPSKHQCMELYTDKGTIEIPMDKVQQVVRESCNYCADMTCEFADLSVGGSRSPEGWEVDKGWNHVIVRTEAGQKLLELAREQGVLEFKEVPEGNLAKIKKAALGKKAACMENMRTKFGDDSGSIYIRNEEA